MNDQPPVEALYGTSGPWAAVLLGVAFVALALAVLRRVLELGGAPPNPPGPKPR